MSLFFDMRVSTTLNLFLQCPIMLYSLQATCIQSVSGGNVTILGHSIGHSKQKTLRVNVSYSQRFPRQSYFTVQEFGFGAQNCASLTPYCALLDFCLWVWMKSEVYRTKVVTRYKFLDLIMDVIASIKESQEARRRANQHVLTRVAKCMAVDGGIFENVLYWLSCTNFVT